VGVGNDTGDGLDSVGLVGFGSLGVDVTAEVDSLTVGWLVSAASLAAASVTAPSSFLLSFVVLGVSDPLVLLLLLCSGSEVVASGRGGVTCSVWTS